MQVSLELNDTTPQLLHVLIFDLYELKTIKTKINNKIGIKIKSSRMFPRKLIKKLNPKIGITTNVIKDHVSKVLLAFRK
tara:strand:+ start:137 stop:373 length:237 start_codon:yes stop_codon:yes gene_type:complete